MSKKHKHPRQEPETLALPLVGADSHAHLDLPEFDADRDEILDRARACGVATIGNVFLGPDAYLRNRRLFAARPEVFFILGIHPCNADTCTEAALAAMHAAFTADARLKAVGEIGLDYYWDDHPRDMQQHAFRSQLDLALGLACRPSSTAATKPTAKTPLRTACAFWTRRDAPDVRSCGTASAATPPRPSGCSSAAGTSAFPGR
jgi:TatD DNase family protein